MDKGQRRGVELGGGENPNKGDAVSVLRDVAEIEGARRERQPAGNVEMKVGARERPGSDMGVDDDGFSDGWMRCAEHVRRLQRWDSDEIANFEDAKVAQPQDGSPLWNDAGRGEEDCVRTLGAKRGGLVWRETKSERGAKPGAEGAGIVALGTVLPARMGNGVWPQTFRINGVWEGANFDGVEDVGATGPLEDSDIPLGEAVGSWVATPGARDKDSLKTKSMYDAMGMQARLPVGMHSVYTLAAELGVDLVDDIENSSADLLFTLIKERDEVGTDEDAVLVGVLIREWMRPSCENPGETEIP